MSESRDAERLPRMLRALAGDAENTDGWEGATGDLRGSADLIERQAKIIEGAIVALEAAKEDVVHWGGYAGAYFQEKHDLAGDVERIENDLATARALTKQ